MSESARFCLLPNNLKSENVGDLPIPRGLRGRALTATKSFAKFIFRNQFLNKRVYLLISLWCLRIVRSIGFSFLLEAFFVRRFFFWYPVFGFCIVVGIGFRVGAANVLNRRVYLLVGI